MSEHLKDLPKVGINIFAGNKKSRWENIAQDTSHHHSHRQHANSTPPVFTSAQAQQIIAIASEKLYHHGLLQQKLSGQQINSALEYFHQHCKQHSSIENIANIALLAVINVFMISEKILPDVTDAENWGSMLARAIYRPHTTALNSLNEPDAYEGLSAQETEKAKVIAIIKERQLRNEFIDKLSVNCRANGLNISPASSSDPGSTANETSSTSASQSGSYAPTLSAAKNPYNPFKTSGGGTTTQDE